MSRLVSRGVDTLIMTGCTTGGCVRASAVDACSVGLHTIVVDDAVGDRAPLSHLTCQSTSMPSTATSRRPMR